eukprot:1148472-Pelagomonas_calceolata.AAC.4
MNSGRMLCAPWNQFLFQKIILLSAASLSAFLLSAAFRQAALQGSIRVSVIPEGADVCSSMCPALLSIFECFCARVSPHLLISMPALTQALSRGKTTLLASAKHCSRRQGIYASRCLGFSTQALLYQSCMARVELVCTSPDGAAPSLQVTDVDYTYPEAFPAVAKDLVDKLLVVDPDERLGRQQAAFWSLYWVVLCKDKTCSEVGDFPCQTSCDAIIDIYLPSTAAHYRASADFLSVFHAVYDAALRSSGALVDVLCAFTCLVSVRSACGSPDMSCVS